MVLLRMQGAKAKAMKLPRYESWTSAHLTYNTVHLQLVVFYNAPKEIFSGHYKHGQLSGCQAISG